MAVLGPTDNVTSEPNCGNVIGGILYIVEHGSFVCVTWDVKMYIFGTDTAISVYVFLITTASRVY